MTWNDLQHIANRSLALTFDRKKLLFTFCLLIAGGWVSVVCHALGLTAGPWTSLGFSFVPIFVAAALLMAWGVVLVRIYHDQIKRRPIDYRQVLFGSWQIIVTAFSLILVLLLAFFVFWIALGFFYVLKEIPVIGNFLAVLLVFAPFLLYLGAYLLVLGAFGSLFFVTPILALRGVSRAKITQTIVDRIQADVFSNLIQVLLAVTPTVLTTIWIALAIRLLGHSGFTSLDAAHTTLQWFIIMIPCTALLAPGVVFFFNLAAEAHVLEQRRNHD